MFNVGPGELLVILVVALIVLGPERLPDAARKVGTVVAELRRLSHGVEDQARQAMTDAAATAAPTEAVAPAIDRTRRDAAA